MPTRGQPLRSGLRNDRACCARRTRNRTVWLSILGISWFWVVGATVLVLRAAARPGPARRQRGGGELPARLCSRSESPSARCLCAQRLSGEITPRAGAFRRPRHVGAPRSLRPCDRRDAGAGRRRSSRCSAVLSAPGVLVVSAVLFVLAAAVRLLRGAALSRSCSIRAPEDSEGAHDRRQQRRQFAHDGRGGRRASPSLSSGLGLSLRTRSLCSWRALNLVAAAIMLRLLSRIVLKTVVRAIL